MARWNVLHPVADRIAPRLSRALGASFDRLRRRVPARELEDALRRGDLRMANELIERMDLEDALKPVGGILRDALLRGGKDGAEELPL